MTALLLNEKELKLLWDGLNLLQVNSHISGTSTAKLLLAKKVQLKIELHAQIVKLETAPDL